MSNRTKQTAGRDGAQAAPAALREGESNACSRAALLATVAAAVCYALSAHGHHLLTAAIVLTLVRAGLNSFASLRAHRPLPDRYSDMLLIAGIAVSGIVDWHWPVLALGSMIVASATSALTHVPGLDGKPFGPTGVIARLVCLLVATGCHWTFLNFGHTPWTLGGQPLEPLIVGTALIAILAQITVVAHGRELLKREADLQWRIDGARRQGGLFAAGAGDIRQPPPVRGPAALSQT